MTRVKPRILSMILSSLTENDRSETILFIVYILPFTTSILHFIKALSSLNPRLFPVLNKKISIKVQEEHSKGRNPLDIIEDIARSLHNPLLNRILSTYSFIARNVGSGTIATLSFFEKAVEAVSDAWERFTGFMKLSLEIYVVITVMAILGLMLSIMNPSSMNYLYIIPLAVVWMLIASIIGNNVLQPPIGNPFNAFKPAKTMTILGYIALVTCMTITLYDPYLATIAGLTCIAGGLYIEYNAYVLEKKYTLFLDGLSAVNNSLQAGYPSSPQIRETVVRHGIQGKLRDLLMLLSESAALTGEIGLRQSFKYVVETVNKGFKEYKKLKYTVLLYVAVTLVASILYLYAFNTIESAGWNSLHKTLSNNRVSCTLKHVYSELVLRMAVFSASASPIAVFASYRGRLPPILVSGIGLIGLQLVAHPL